MQVFKEYTTDIGGKTCTVQFTDLAEQANGSVLVRYGNTVVLATAVMSDKTRNDIDYFPLTVDYEERFYAAGQILGSRFVRREGRPSEDAVLSGRVVDRTIRPLFHHSLRNEVQVVITILSIDEDDPDIVAVNAASLALATSDIPWDGPASAVRIGKHHQHDALTVNPSYLFRDDAEFAFDLIACGTGDTINMIELGANEADETTVVHALARASEEIEKLQKFQQRIIDDVGAQKRAVAAASVPQEIHSLFAEHIQPDFREAVFQGAGKKHIHALKDRWLARAEESLSGEALSRANRYFEEQVDALIHREALDNERRADGRKLDELRPIYAKAGGVSPVLHGSGIFYRGGTHIFSALTLGGPSDSLIVDTMEEQETKKRFMHHYNFPPFSAGETGRVGGFNRRMIGHGALAERALIPVIPPQDTFPYTIRLVSEALASNGSTSMGSVCASTLALMDGGVPITRPVAGIAMGLMTASPSSQMDADENARMSADNLRYKILTDIQGPEDEHGDMDCKVAGTREGVTAIQMDVKVAGIPVVVLAEALHKARDARLRILDVMEKEIPAPRDHISPRAPEIVTMRINPELIGTLIGPSGKTINGIKTASGVDDISVEEDGRVFITGAHGTAARAHALVEEITHEYTKGERLEGEVARVEDYGAFVKVGANTEGLVHISEVAPFRINAIRDILKVGDTVPVVVRDIDERGRLSLSIKSADPDFAKSRGATPNTPGQS